METHRQRIRFQDILDYTAYTRIEGDALVRLCERAGAPWSEEDKTARLGELQKAILRRPERRIIVEAGSGGGKSILGACFGLGELMQPNRKIVIVADQAKFAHKEFSYIYLGMKTLFGDAISSACPTFVNKKNGHVYTMQIATAWGSTCEGMTLAQKGGSAALGNEWDMCIIGEGAHLSPDVYFGKINRALARRIRRRERSNYIRPTGRTIALSSPNELNGTLQAIIRAAKKQTGGRIEKLRCENSENWFESLYYSVHTSPEMNPNYSFEAYEAEKEMAKAAGQEAAFGEQFEGIAQVRTGIIYSKKTDDHEIDLPNIARIRAMKLGLGIDVGHRYAAVLAGLDSDENAYILGECYVVGGTTSEKTELTLEMAAEILQIEPEEVNDALSVCFIDRSAQNRPDFEELGLDVEFTHELWRVEDTLDTVNQKFAEDKLFIVNDCVELISEASMYQWKGLTGGASVHTAGTLRPSGKHDVLDAMRYVLLALWESGPPEGAPEIMAPEQETEQALYNLQRTFAEPAHKAIARREQMEQGMAIQELFRGL